MPGLPPGLLERAAELTHDQCMMNGGREVRLLLLAAREVARLSVSTARFRNFAEIFAGSGGAAQAVRADGLEAVTFDRGGPHGHSDEDSTLLAGLLYMGLIVCSLQIGGVCWIAPECATWVWMARGHTLRDLQNIFGDTERVDVMEANCTALVVQLA